jgi:hypothetical protein
MGWSSTGTKTARSVRAAVVAIGIAAGQLLLFGPSLTGEKILLPLDILAWPGIYLPATPEAPRVSVHNPALSDQVLALEPSRRFAAAEMRAGRIPLWTPYGFAGAPFADFAKYSPFNLVYTLLPSPFTLAWIQLLKSLVAGLGAYLFFRRALRVSFWPAAFGAWCYPLSGFFVLWQGYPSTFVTAWFPWLLVAVDGVVRRPFRAAGPALGALTGLTLVSGQLDVAGQVLLASGLYALLLLASEHGRRIVGSPALRALASLIAAFTIGFALAAPYVLPLLEYAQSGARMRQRAEGAEERPPVGPSALRLVVVPNADGSMERGSMRLRPDNRIETASAAYTGLLATLVLAPLAWCSRPHRRDCVRWLLLATFGLGWTLDVPGIVALLRLPVLNLMSHNRLVFLTAFGILALAVVGLEVLQRERLRRRLWFGLPMALLVALFGWCVYRSLQPPEAVENMWLHVQQGRTAWGISDPSTAAEVMRGFTATYLAGALLSGLGLVGWATLCLSRSRGWLAPTAGALTIAELLMFGRGINPQTDPALDYPEIPVLAQLSERPPGRILGLRCLPPRLAESQGLRDVRGYDGVDPATLVDLMNLAARDDSPRNPYAQTQAFQPRGGIAPPNLVDLPPVLDLLGVRYVILRGTPRHDFEPLLAGGDYWVLENQEALPRAFVPRRTMLVREANERLRLLGADDFDPRELALIEQPIELAEPARGSARVIDELPRRLELAADMRTPGLLVLADLWDPGWRASLDGQPAPILRVDHALRGVVVPAGRSVVVFDYAPASFTWGVRCLGAGMLALLIWIGASVRRTSRRWNSLGAR